MFETNICVVGNVLTAPEWRRTSASGRLVTTFKVAAATRRLDRTTGAWADGNGLRVRVSCWRDLAGGVASSVMVGDPVIVYGQIYTRDWVDKDGTKRTIYEMEAQAVGHNLARGRARFARNKPVSASEVESDPTQPVRLGGELTEPAADQPTGLDPSDPLRLDDGGVADSFGFEEPFTGLMDNGEGWGDPDPLAPAGPGAAGGLVSGSVNAEGLAPRGAADLPRGIEGLAPHGIEDLQRGAADLPRGIEDLPRRAVDLQGGIEDPPRRAADLQGGMEDLQRGAEGHPRDNPKPDDQAGSQGFPRGTDDLWDGNEGSQEDDEDLRGDDETGDGAEPSERREEGDGPRAPEETVRTRRRRRTPVGV